MKLIDGISVYAQTRDIETNEFDANISLEMVAACAEYAKKEHYVSKVVRIERAGVNKSVLNGELYSYPYIYIETEDSTGLIMAHAKMVNGKWSIVGENNWPAD